MSCNGANLAVISAEYCITPITTLLAAPFSLPWGSSIYTRVTAINAVGSSISSNDGNGAVILTVPDAPVSLANNAAATTATIIAMTWSPGASNGGTVIIDYRIYYD